MDSKKKLMSEYQLRNLKILAHLLENDSVEEEIIEFLHKSELEYFSMVDKCNILEDRVNVDSKTGLLKYRSDYLTTIIKEASRIFNSTREVYYDVSLIRFDIDDFSLFNDKYGHSFGDTVLIAIASVLKQNSRPTDYIIRFGGEEFDVLLPSTDLQGSLTYCKRIYNDIADLSFNHNNKTLKATMSSGISHLSYDITKLKAIQDTHIEDLFATLQDQADKALYEAKLSGKNRFCIYTEENDAVYDKMRSDYSMLKHSKVTSQFNN